jgi:tRNA uridine 5-carboxymethylaminomethyl modification enzyme
LVAGLNAAKLAAGEQSVYFSRAESYIGVMVDDLTSRGVTEPYRMFTSRAEYRLSLRADNADQRLTPVGLAIGCVGSDRSARFIKYMSDMEAARSLLRDRSITPREAERAGIHLNQDGQRRTAYELLSYSEHSVASLSRLWPELSDIDRRSAEALEIEAAYSVYMARQSSDIAQRKHEEDKVFPPEFDFSELAGLSNELRQKLSRARPHSVAQAATLDGMTPAALSLLIAHLRKLAAADLRKSA